MKQPLSKRMLNLLLVLAMLLSFALPVHGADGGQQTVCFQQVDNREVSESLLKEATGLQSETQTYADTDMVRVSILLEDRSTIDAGFSTGKHCAKRPGYGLSSEAAG